MDLEYQIQSIRDKMNEKFQKNLKIIQKNGV